MPSIEHVLLDKLSQDSHAVWLDAWRAVVDEVRGREVLSRISVLDGAIARPLPPVNDPVWRLRAIKSAEDLPDLCGVRLLRHFDVLNSTLVTYCDSIGRAYDKRSRPRMLRHIKCVLPRLLSQPVSDVALVGRSAFDIWRSVANVLGRRAYSEANVDQRQSDTALHNLLLLAGYFYACKLPDEHLVSIQLDEFRRRSVMSVQGTLVDIVERVSWSGVDDARPKLAADTGQVKLKNQSLSPLLDVLVTEANYVAEGRGFLFRSFGSIETNVPPKAGPQVLLALRSVAYGQYEHTMLGFMALSAIEQLLRTFGFVVGLLKGNEQINDNRIGRIASRLGGDPNVRQALDTVYGRGCGNLRNRVLHGAQLHIRRHQFQDTLAIAAPGVYAPIEDEFSPQNTCRLCLNCLEAVDDAIARVVTLKPEDLDWAKHFELSTDQIRTGMAVYCDFQGAEGKVWWDRISAYLSAVTPSVRLLFDFGFVGWINRARGDRFVLFVSLNMILEALFRAAVRLQGGEVLRKFIVSDSRSVAFRYKMLDERELCAPKVLTRLVESVNPAERQVAKEVLLLAVRVRNAVAHGAVARFDTDAGLAMGHLLVKAIQCLVEAGEHEMIKVAAYYRWRKHQAVGVDALADWLHGEREVMEMIAGTQDIV